MARGGGVQIRMRGKVTCEAEFSHALHGSTVTGAGNVQPQRCGSSEYIHNCNFGLAAKVV